MPDGELARKCVDGISQSRVAHRRCLPPVHLAQLSCKEPLARRTSVGIEVECFSIRDTARVQGSAVPRRGISTRSRLGPQNNEKRPLTLEDVGRCLSRSCVTNAEGSPT
jgi:hypothetical protein